MTVRFHKVVRRMGDQRQPFETCLEFIRIHCCEHLPNSPLVKYRTVLTDSQACGREEQANLASIAGRPSSANITLRFQAIHCKAGGGWPDSKVGCQLLESDGRLKIEMLKESNLLCGKNAPGLVIHRMLLVASQIDLWIEVQKDISRFPSHMQLV